MTGADPVLVGLLLYLAVAVAPTLLCWAAIRAYPRVVAQVAARRAARLPPAGPTLETLVERVRRLRREVRSGPAPNQVRMVALLAAYDETLVQLCGLLGIESLLTGAAPADRALARMRTEAEVELAGVALDPPRGGRAAA